MRAFVSILSLALLVAVLVPGLSGSARAASPCCKAFQGACANPSQGVGPRSCHEIDDGNCVGGGLFDDGAGPNAAFCICITAAPPQNPGCIADTTTMLWLQGRRGNPSTNDTNPSNGDALCTAAAERACRGLVSP